VSTDQEVTVSRTYITVAIPYVNARPHVGYALELVQADVLARHLRACGDDVRFLGGTDDHALKNVLGAEAAGVPPQEFVDGNAAAFEALRCPLDISFDDFIRTSRDPRHAAGVERLWRACEARGDFYRQWYEGQYCVGCEQFYATSDLVDGRCPEHRTPTEAVAEQNWFFRLSRYRDSILSAIERGELTIVPETFQNEVLAFLAAGLEDISVSRSDARARGWGIPVPDDPTQRIYVWWDALGNYITALDYGTHGEPFDRWWRGADERIHVIGKGILRFHAVYWPAILLSAGELLPTKILVHPYLTAGGEKLSKSRGTKVDPTDVVAEVGTDALRWWFARDVPRAADADFSLERVIARADEDLAHGIGNLVHRVTTMIHRLKDGVAPLTRTLAHRDTTRSEFDAAVRGYDYGARSRLCAPKWTPRTGVSRSSARGRCPASPTRSTARSPNCWHAPSSRWSSSMRSSPPPPVPPWPRSRRTDPAGSRLRRPWSRCCPCHADLTIREPASFKGALQPRATQVERSESPRGG
jgi:methionyl-tRNA synthetase